MERYRQRPEKRPVGSMWINSSHPGMQLDKKYTDPGRYWK